MDSVDGCASKLKPDVHEAYVTFRRSEDAYKAFIENRNDSKSFEELITVLPVNTWKISPSRSEDDEMAEISQRIISVDDKADPRFIYRLYITPGMLLKVFRSLLRVSKNFLNGLDLHYELYNEFDLSDCETDDSTVDSTDEETAETALAKKMEKKSATESPTDAMGKLKCTVKIEEMNCIQDHEFEKRISEIVVQNLGPKFETLTIRKETITREMLQWFAPVLKQLNNLIIYTDSDCSILYALHEYCPNVSNFHLDGDEWTGEFDQVPIEQWPSLTELYMNITTLNDDENSNEGNKKFQRFIEVNPQITAMQIESAIDLDTLSTIGKTLVDLNTLAFVRNSFEGLNSVLDNLSGLKKMCGLKISVMEVEKNYLNGLFKCAKRLSRLPELQLVTIFLNCEPTTKTRENFLHLEEFCITHHRNCQCHSPNRILSFQDYDIEIPEESSVLVLIVNTKPPAESADKTLEADILSAFKKTTKFYPNIIEYTEIEEENSYVYIQISSD